MKTKLNELHELHDNLKENPIRLAGLSDNKIPYNAKDLYYRKLSIFLNEVIDYFNEFKEEEHVIKGLNYCKKNNYDLDRMKLELDSCYYIHSDLLTFLADTDFKIYSPLHYIIEYLYYYLTNGFKSEEFKVRIK